MLTKNICQSILKCKVYKVYIKIYIKTGVLNVTFNHDKYTNEYLRSSCYYFLQLEPLRTIFLYSYNLLKNIFEKVENQAKLEKTPKLW